jgi:thiamine kinase-like enzyme
VKSRRIKAPPAEAVSELFDLGIPKGPVEPVPAGLSHRMWRLETTHGVFAVKQLNRDWANPDYVDWYERAFSVEMAAFYAGISVPRPIAAHGTGHCLAELPGHNEQRITVRVHEWMGGEPIDRISREEGVLAEVGGILAQIHLLELKTAARPDEVLRVHGNQHWSDLTERLLGTCSVWAEELRRCLVTINELEAFVVASRMELGTPHLSHRDADQKNFMVTSEGRLLLVDWDAAGPINPRHEIAKECLNWAGAHVGMPDQRLAQALLAGYRRAGGDYSSPRPSDFGEFVCDMLGWLEFNVRRTLGERLQDASDRSLGETQARMVLAKLPRIPRSIPSWVRMLA